MARAAPKPRVDKYCQGYNNIQCAFGPGGKRARPNGPEALGDPARAAAARKRMARLSPEMQAVALGRVREPGYRNWLAAVAAQPEADVEEVAAGKHCQGYNGIQCAFGPEGEPARPHGPARCLFCNPERLQEALNTPLRAAAARRRFAQLSREAQEAVLERVLQPEHRDQLAAAQPLLEVEEPAPRPYRRQDQSWRGVAPYTSEDLAARYSAGAAAWEEVLRQRQAVAEPNVAEVEYRVKVVDDRRKSLNMMQQAEPRLPRGAEVSNEDPLPKAASTRLAANLQLWAEFNSWQVCDSCGALQPRDLAPAGLRGLLRPNCDARHCIFCRSARPAPRPQPPPDALRGLSQDVRQALQPAEPDFGPVIRSRDQFGRGNGYRQHAKLVTFSWAAASVTDKIAALPQPAQSAARRAFDLLLACSGPAKDQSAYADFYWEHESFLANNMGCDARVRRRWLRFMEKEGLECALWPDLFLERQHCLTWARLQSSSRQARGSERSTLKRSYMALVLSPILDFSRLQHEVYEALHQAHLLTQIGKNFVVGEGRERRGHEEELQLLQRQRLDGSEASVVSFLRLEFQDGKRRNPSQDYHGSGRAHAHQLIYVGSERRDEDIEALRLERCVQATLEVEPASLCRVARGDDLLFGGQLTPEHFCPAL
ncbi:unnamed protein product [Effrenium voratum]|nr:unnamed protein product [Effrenium voratum]